MSRPAPEAIVRTLLDQEGRTFCQELRIPIEKNTPSALFQWLCVSLLMSARISSAIAMDAARSLFREGWRTPQRMAEATWEQRTRVLNRSGYARYDEKTSRMLAATSELVLTSYKGDLRRLREAADHDPPAERKLLREAKGIGDVGVDIFFREVQVAWPELYPFVDRKALSSAAKLGLPTDPQKLAELAGRERFPDLVAALVRVDLSRRHRDIREAA